MPMEKRNKTEKAAKIQKGNPENSPLRSTIFDDVLRTMLEKMPDLAIPLINEVFRTSYSMDVKIIQLRNENQTQSGRIISDTRLLIKGKIYHMEVQSTSDGKMIIRMIEYDFASGLEQVRKENGTYVMEFPHSCIIWLRGTHKRDSIQMELRFPDNQKVIYRVPVLWLSDYTSCKKIFQKNLLLLLPYYIIKYEKTRKRLEYDEEYLQSMLAEYRDIVNHLEKELLNKEREKDYRDMIELITRIADYILRNSKKSRTEVDKILGGKVLKLKTDELIEQGEKIGEKRGVKIGEVRGEERINNLFQHLSADGRIDDFRRSCTDRNYQKELLKEYGIL